MCQKVKKDRNEHILKDPQKKNQQKKNPHIRMIETHFQRREARKTEMKTFSKIQNEKNFQKKTFSEKSERETISTKERKTGILEERKKDIHISLAHP